MKVSCSKTPSPKMSQLDMRFNRTVHIGTALRAALTAIANPTGNDGPQTDMPFLGEVRRESSVKENLRIETGGRHAKSIPTK